MDDEFHLSVAEQSLGGSVPLMTTVVGLLVISGAIAPRLESRVVIAALAAGLAALQAGTALAPGPGAYIVLGALVGLLGPFEPILRGLVARALPVEAAAERRRQGLIGGVFSFALAGFAASFPAVAQAFGWRWAFGLSAIVSALLAVAAWAVLPDDVPDRPPSSGAGVAAPRAVVWLALLDGAAYGVMVGSLSVVLKDHGLVALLWLFGLRRVGPFFAGLGWNKVIDRSWAPPAAALAMLVPMALWLAGLRGVGHSLLVALLGVYLALDVISNLVWATIPVHSPGIVAARVAGIATGMLVGLTGHGTWRDLGVIVPFTMFVIAEIPWAFAIARRGTPGKPEPFDGTDIVLGGGGRPVVTVGGQTRPFRRGTIALGDDRGEVLTIRVRRDRPRLRASSGSRTDGHCNLVGRGSAPIPFAPGYVAVVHTTRRACAEVTGSGVRDVRVTARRPLRWCIYER